MKYWSNWKMVQKMKYGGNKVVKIGKSRKMYSNKQCWETIIQNKKSKSNKIKIKNSFEQKSKNVPM